MAHIRASHSWVPWLTFTLSVIFATVHCHSSNLTKQCNASNEFGNSDVAVQESTLEQAGLGAFALRPFKRGEAVGLYHCIVWAQPDHLDNTYSWQLNSTHSCDGESIPLRNPMRYVNSVARLDTCDRQNLVVDIAQHHKHGKSPVRYIATRDMAKSCLLTMGKVISTPGRECLGCGTSAINLPCTSHVPQAISTKCAHWFMNSLQTKRAHKPQL